MTRLGLIALLAACSCAAAGDDQPPIHFEDVTASSGIDFVTTSGVDPSSQIVEVKGGGVVLIDFDNDGDEDLFFPNGATLADPQHGPGARLYENLGGLRFRDVTAGSGIDHHSWSFGSAVGDVDGDGRDDMFIACLGEDALYRNLGGGRFALATGESGLAGDRNWSTSAAMGDFDGDGDLDLFVTNYVALDLANLPAPVYFRGVQVMSGPRGLAALGDRIYENTGGGKFVDRTVESGLSTVKPAFGLNCAIVDLTRDGRPDIYVNNDSMDNHLLENLGGFRFRDVGASKGCATNIEGAQQASMGLAVGDVNGDRSPDLFSTNFSDDTNTLFVSSPVGFFDDKSAQYGVGIPSRPLCGWASALADLDHDGDEDLLVVNGHVYPQATLATMNSDYRQPKLLMERRGGKFVRVSDPAQGWLTEPRRDRSAVVADLDADGDLDAVVTGLNQPVQVLRNMHDSPSDWVSVQLDDQRNPANRRGVGARVELLCGDEVQVRWLIGGGPFQSNCTWRVHFGVGKCPGEELQLRVTWPDGETSLLPVRPGEHAKVTRAATP